MKVAVIHDWLLVYAGAERVLEQILKVFPQADLYSVVEFLPVTERGFILDKPVQTSFIQRLPFAKTRYRFYLPFMPLAIEQFDLSRYDVIISSSYAVAKGVLTGPDQLHISYVHSPLRYAWDLQHQYLTETGLDRGVKGWLARLMLHRIRLWDVRTANGVDHFVANSRFIARRIRKVYRREAQVLHPPVDTSSFSLLEAKEDFYLTASRLVPYKRIDLIADAFKQMPDKRLVIIGDGPDYRKIAATAGANVSVLGHQPFDALKAHMQRARAFIFAAEEDFGIVPVEAMACGTPVIAYGRGGVRETVRGLGHAEPTGVFFDRQTPEAIVSAVQTFEQHRARFVPEHISRHAASFAAERFRTAFARLVERQWQDFQAELEPPETRFQD